MESNALYELEAESPENADIEMSAEPFSMISEFGSSVSLNKSSEQNLFFFKLKYYIY